MKITLTTTDDRVSLEVYPTNGAQCVAKDRRVLCSSCNGIACHGGATHHDHDTYYARAFCVGCGAELGQLEVKISTIFGIEEDRAVLHGRPRVY